MNKAESKDAILRFVLKEWEQVGKGTKFPCTSKSIQEGALPSLEIYFVQMLIEELMEFSPKILDRLAIYDQYRATELTKHFLKEGGFTGIYAREEKEREEHEEIERITNEKLRHDAKLSKWQAKTFWWVFIGGLIGGLMGVTALILELEDRKYIKFPIELKQSQPEQPATLPDSNNNLTEPE